MTVREEELRRIYIQGPEYGVVSTYMNPGHRLRHYKLKIDSLDYYARHDGDSRWCLINDSNAHDGRREAIQNAVAKFWPDQNVDMKIGNESPAVYTDPNGKPWVRGVDRDEIVSLDTKYTALRWYWRQAEISNFSHAKKAFEILWDRKE